MLPEPVGAAGGDVGVATVLVGVEEAASPSVGCWVCCRTTRGLLAGLCAPVVLVGVVGVVCVGCVAL
jgi:hypothetical protein